MYTIEEFDNLKTRVLKYVLYRRRTESEVRNKFKKDMESDILDDIIEHLKELNYINDSEYIDVAVREFIRLNSLSCKELLYKLYTKGLQRDIIEPYFEENIEMIDEYELNSARKIVSKKINLLEKKDLKQYLLRKGYREENIEKSIKEM